MKKKTQKNKLGKFLTIFVILCIIVFVLILICNVCMTNDTKDRIFTQAELENNDYDCILVLGAGIKDDGTPSGILKDRLDTAIMLYQKGICTTLLMSGDHGKKDYDEVNSMKKYAIDHGVAPEHIFLDHAGFSTYESIYRAKEIFDAKRILIVTQQYHLYRALYVSEKLDIEAAGVTADLHEYRGKIVREVRETLARTKEFVNCIFKPKPTYLGDKIDLKGDSAQTNG